jgi:hypothetical protein
VLNREDPEVSYGLWHSSTPSAKHCWALATRLSQANRHGPMTIHGYPAAALLACWATQVELGSSPSPPLSEQAATAAAKHGQAGERWRGSGAPAHRICSGFFAAQRSPQRRRRRRASDRCVRFRLPLFRARAAARDSLHSFRPH